MASNLKYSGLEKKSITIPAYSMATIEYNETLPNYYRVQNRGKTRLFCGTSHIPTANNYDFSVGGEKVKMYGEPFRKNNLYIFNPSAENIGVTVVSFAAEFDPSTLALCDLELDFSNTALETSAVISGFSSPLPTGSNKIGMVSVENFADILDSLKKDREVTTVFASAGFTELTTNEDNRICELIFFSNDDTEDITFTVTNADGLNIPFVIKAGEVLNNVKMWATKITFENDGKAFRCCANYAKV